MLISVALPVTVSKLTGDLPVGAGLYQTLAYVEKQMIVQALRRSNNVQAHAAAQLGIGKSGLNQKLKKYGIDVSDLEDGESRPE